MIKRILIYVLIIATTFLISFILHQYILNNLNLVLSYSLLQVYLFHVIATIVVYGIIEYVADKLPSQAGYAYLTSVFLKIGFFTLIFQSSILSEVKLPLFERVSLIAPFFLFLLIEAIFTSKLLNTKIY